MAGRPIQAAFADKLALVATSAGADSPEEYLFARIANGELLSHIAIDLGVHRTLIYRWINTKDERAAAFKEARKLASHSLADDVLDIVDNANPATVGVARERAKYRQWLAQSFNREQYAPNAPANASLTINIGSLHLSALEHAQTYSRMDRTGEEGCLPGKEELEVYRKTLPRIEDAVIVQSLSKSPIARGTLALPADSARQLGSGDTDQPIVTAPITQSTDDSEHATHSNDNDLDATHHADT